MSGKGRGIFSILRMWEFWLNYLVILLVLLPVPALKMSYVVTMNGKDIPQEPQTRAVWECYKFAQIEGLKNPWNPAVIAIHWLVPFGLMFIIWSLLVRRKISSDDDERGVMDGIVGEIVDEVIDAVDYD